MAPEYVGQSVDGETISLSDHLAGAAVVFTPAAGRPPSGSVAAAAVRGGGAGPQPASVASAAFSVVLGRITAVVLTGSTR